MSQAFNRLRLSWNSVVNRKKGWPLRGCRNHLPDKSRRSLRFLQARSRSLPRHPCIPTHARRCRGTGCAQARAHRPAEAQCDWGNTYATAAKAWAEALAAVFAIAKPEAEKAGGRQAHGVPPYSPSPPSTSFML